MTRSEQKTSLYEIIYSAVRKIPRGRVATYGEIARLCGLREHARLVGYALHNLKPDSGVPWHRVINSQGRISLPKDNGTYEFQKKLLESEGIVFVGDKIDLTKYGAGASDKKSKR